MRSELLDSSADDLLDHSRVTLSFLKLRGSDPDSVISGQVLSCLVKDDTGVLIGLELGKSEPELSRVGDALSSLVEERLRLLGFRQGDGLLPEFDV